MKLWQVIQWGNPDEGGNGKDTQCIVSAKDLSSAVEKGFLHIERYNEGIENWETRIDTVRLLGQDDRPDGEPILIVGVWLAHAQDMPGNASWHQSHRTKEWLTTKEMFGEDK